MYSTLYVLRTLQGEVITVFRVVYPSRTVSPIPFLDIQFTGSLLPELFLII